MRQIRYCSTIVLLFLLQTRFGFSQYVLEHLKAAYFKGELSYIQYLEYSALNAFEPDQVPQKYRISGDERPLKSGTFLMQQVKQNWDKLSPTTQQILAKYLQRRQMPFHYITPDGKFCIHYDITGIDAVDPTDNNSNGIPDYVELTGEYFTYIHHLLIDSLGYNSPPPDSSGKGKEFDVYLVNLSIWYGITYLEAKVPGTENAYSCYMEIENDFRNFPTSPLNSLRVTSAHEYFHVVQVGYTYREADVFFMEMCSTWMEDFAHSDVNDYLNYLNSFFRHINYPFSYVNNNYEYASCLWNHMIVKKYGADVILKIWQKIPAEPAMNAISDVLLEYGTSFRNELASFGLWNYFTGSRSDTMAFYPEGFLYPEVNFKDEVTTFGENVNFESRMCKLSSSYFEIDDQLNHYSLGIIVTNFETPLKNSSGNYDPADKADFSLAVYMLPQDSLQRRDYISSYNLIKISDFHGIRLNIKHKDNWYARAVVFDPLNNYQITQFFPAYSGNNSRNFIENIFPNPLIIGENDPLIITYFVHDEELGDLLIYSSDGRLIKKHPFDAFNFYYDTFEWDGCNENGEPVSSGVYVALLRVGKSVNIKKFAIIRK